MGIVHSALRRDLERTRVALTTAPYPDGARRRAIGDHLLAMMHFLHVHHHGEDAGLWPMVRQGPVHGLLLERMERDHEQIAPAISALEEAAEGYRGGALDREPLLSALAGLTGVLLPHLEREETEAMPVVSATLSQAAWGAYEQDHAVGVKTFLELGDEGQWVLDGLDEEDRR